MRGPTDDKARVASFGVLLAHDQIHPLVLYALQLYLSF